MVQADDEFHVLADDVFPVAADLDDRLLFEEAESAGNHQKAIKHAQSHAARQEGPEIFKNLKVDQPFSGGSDRQRLAGVEVAAVGDADEPAGGHHLGVGFHKRMDDAQKGLALQEGIGIDAANQGIGADVDAGVQGVRLAAVFFVHNQ